MNICFLQGKIISKIDFKFFYNSKKHISIAKFKVLLNPKMDNYKDKTVVFVKGYDEVADAIYREFEKGEDITFMGYVKEYGVEVCNVENKSFDNKEIL